MRFQTSNRAMAFFLFSIGVLTFSLFNLPDAGALQANVARYSREEVGLKDAVVRYHEDMNELFNTHLEKLLSGGSFVVEPPEDRHCSDQKNISTYCLSIRAVEQYDAFVQAMDTHRSFARDKEDGSRKNFEELSAELDRRLKLINQEVILAEQVMSATIGAYDQVQTFYPLHVQYNALIKELEIYRDGLANVRREVEKYPGKFHNVTTAQCT